MTRYNSLADLRRSTEGDWTAREPDYAAPSRTEAHANLRNAGSLGGAQLPAPTEHEEQVRLFEWAAANEEEIPALRNLVAFPNGGYRPMATAAMLKREGVKAGLPDMALFCKRGGYGALFIELKRADRSNGCTLEQCDWIDRLCNYGYQALVCFGAQEAINAITHYLNLE